VTVITQQDVTALLSTLVAICPNSLVQQRLGQICNEMYAAGETPKDVYVTLLQTGLDGLNYENWPYPVVKH
jgi:hypothetical protein